MLLKVPDRCQKMRAVVHRGANEAPKEPTLPRLDVQRSPSPGNALHPASTPELQAESRLNERPGHAALQSAQIFAQGVVGHRWRSCEFRPTALCDRIQRRREGGRCESW